MKNKTENKKDKKGFTLIELLMIISVILILVTVILVSIFKSRVRSNGTAALYSMKSAASASYSCLSEVGLSGVQLTSPSGAHTSLCAYNSGGVLIDDPSYADWPDVTKKSWNITLQDGAAANPLGSGDSDGFYWCRLGSAAAVHPTDVGTYSNENYGGGNMSGDFCFVLKNKDMYIWCTSNGCRSDGF